MLKPQVKGVRLLKCINSFLLKKKKKKSDTSWASGTKGGTTCSRPAFCRQTNRGAGWIPQRGGPGALGSLWLCLVAQTIAWVRGCTETVNPPSKVLKSFPLALVDLCGLELIIDWESERTQSFPSVSATIADQVPPAGVGRGWW